MPAKSSDRPPLILACDTTQGACSVALYQDGLLGDACQEMTKGHAEALMPMLEKLCVETGIATSAISRIGVTHGPGTFTGVRVGLAAMRGLALALNVPVKTYGTLAVMAAAAHRVKKAEDPLLVVVDAKRDTFYAQIFDPKARPMDAPAALSTAQLSAFAKEMGTQHIAVCGTGAPILSEIWDGFYALDAPVFPQAAILAAIAAQDDDWHDLPPAEPLYLRPPDASLPDPEKRIQWRGARPI